jgi:hypothetical protein
MGNSPDKTANDLFGDLQRAKENLEDALKRDDAVAAANLVAAPLREGRLTTEDLCRVQRRREWPTRLTQRIQVLVQNRVIKRVSGSTERGLDRGHQYLNPCKPGGNVCPMSIC